MTMSDVEKLIEDNMNLVYYIIHREYPTFIHDEDVVQSGMLGLCKAANTWDENRAKFSTYAHRCIRNEINKEFIRRKPYSKMVSLNNKIGEKGTYEELMVGDVDVNFVDDSEFRDQLTDDENKIMMLFNMGYSTAEISKIFGYPIKKVQKMLRILKRKGKKFYGS